MKVKCKKKSEILRDNLGMSGGITENSIYIVLALTVRHHDSTTMFTIRNDDHGSIGLYNSDIFEVVDEKLSSTWVYKKFIECDGFVLAPREWSAIDFWEKVDKGYIIETDALESISAFIENEA